MGHVNVTVDAFKVPATERGGGITIVQLLKRDTVETQIRQRVQHIPSGVPVRPAGHQSATSS